MRQDTITRIICDELNLRACAVTSLDTVRNIISTHGTSPNATVALGRTINAAALMSATLKPDSNQSIALKFAGDGPVKEIHVQADARGNLRGYVANPYVDQTEDIGKISFSRTIGAGFLYVIKDLGMKEPYSSIMPLMYGDVAGDLSYYLTSSEQIPSAVILALDLDREGTVISSGGILIQTFPETPEESIGLVESNIRSLKISLGELLLKGVDITAIVAELFGNRAMTVLESNPLRSQCRCERGVLLKTLEGLEREELLDMLQQDRGVEMTCTFCKKTYYFSEDDLAAIISQKSG